MKQSYASNAIGSYPEEASQKTADQVADRLTILAPTRRKCTRTCTKISLVPMANAPARTQKAGEPMPSYWTAV